MKRIILYGLEIAKAFWDSSITIMWSFVPLLLLMSYKPELIDISISLLELRIFLIRTWGYFWTVFFILNSYFGINKVRLSSFDTSMQEVKE